MSVAALTEDGSRLAVYQKVTEGPAGFMGRHLALHISVDDLNKALPAVRRAPVSDLEPGYFLEEES